MTITVNVSLDGIVEGVPKYNGKFHSGPFFSVPFKITRVSPSYQDHGEVVHR